MSSKSQSKLSKRTLKAIELLDQADNNNPNVVEKLEAEQQLVIMEVVEEETGGFIYSEQNVELVDWWEANRC